MTNKTIQQIQILVTADLYWVQDYLGFYYKIFFTLHIKYDDPVASRFGKCRIEVISRHRFFQEARASRKRKITMKA